VLVIKDDQRGEARYRFLETVRQYAAERLHKSGEAAAVRRSHAQFCLGLAEETEGELIGPNSLVALGNLQLEHDNLRAALAWAGEVGEADVEVRLAGALYWFWLRSGHVSEGRRWLEAALERPGASIPTWARAKALCGAGFLAFSRVDQPVAGGRRRGARSGCCLARSNDGSPNPGGGLQTSRSGIAKPSGSAGQTR
jgi:hypothetical protein